MHRILQFCCSQVISDMPKLAMKSAFSIYSSNISDEIILSSSAFNRFLIKLINHIITSCLTALWSLRASGAMVFSSPSVSFNSPSNQIIDFSNRHCDHFSVNNKMLLPVLDHDIMSPRFYTNFSGCRSLDALNPNCASLCNRCEG